MEGFLHPSEYRRSVVVFYEPSVSAQKTRETQKQEQEKKKGAGYTVAKFHHRTSS